MVKTLLACYQVSTRRACEVLRFERSSFYYQSRKNPQIELRIRIRDLAASRVRYGYRRLHILLLREGWQINHKRVYRIYKQEGLSLRLKSKKKRTSQPRSPMPRPTAPNHIWSMDFMADRLANGRQIRLLTLVDNFSRESPAIEVDFSLNGKRVVEVLEHLKWTFGLPKAIKVDNGSEFISKIVDQWAYQNQVKLEFSRPGKPIDNAFIESFNGRVRQECLNQHWFESLEEARIIIEKWRIDYNQERPHSSLGFQTPSEFVVKWQKEQTAEKGSFLTLETVQ
jgi:putative transposase